METKEAVAVVPVPAFSTQMNFSYRTVEGAKRLAFDTMRKDIDRLSTGMEDVVMPLGDTRFVTGVGPTGIGIRIEGTEFGFTPWALSQMSNRLQKGLSASLVSNISGSGNPKKLKVLKNLLTVLREDQPERELLFRTMDVPKMRGQAGVKGPIIRGVLTTSRYSATDNGQILDTLEKVIPDGWGTSEFAVNFEGLSARFVDKTIIMPEGRKMDRNGMFAGLMLQNSEVGKKSISLNAFFYRLVCSNGLCMPSAIFSFNRKHTGDVLEDFTAGVGDLVSKLPDLQERMKHAIERARAKTMTPKRSLGLLNAALEDPDGARPLIKKLGGKETALTALQHQVKHEADGMGGKVTRWGVVNALTREAQILSIEPRLKLETYAADMLLDGDA